MIDINYIRHRLEMKGLCKSKKNLVKKVTKMSKGVLTFPVSSGNLNKLFDGDEVEKG